jgi:hypothetical protein
MLGTFAGLFKGWGGMGLLIFPDVVFVGVRHYVSNEHIEPYTQKAAEQYVGRHGLRIGIGDNGLHFFLSS